MHLKVKDFEKIMENLAPESLKEDYDNVGLMIGDGESEITSILVALDCTMDVINEALERNCNLIFSHHPPLFLKPSSLAVHTLIGRKFSNLVKHDISVYSSHTNLDSAANGLSDCFARILGFEEWSVLETSPLNKACEKDNGVGRIVTLKEPKTLLSFCTYVKEKLCIEKLRYSGADNNIVKKVALLNGSGEDYFALAEKLKVDCIVTGDTKYHYVSDFHEMGIPIIDAGHFETEWPSLKLFSFYLQEKIKTEGFDCKVALSETCRSPYKYV